MDGGALPDVAIDAPSDTGMPDTSVGPDSADTLLSGEDASDAEDTSTVKDTVPFEDTSRPEDTGLQRDTAALADTIEPMDTRVSPDTSVPEDTTASSDTAPPADTTPGCVLHSDCDQSDRCIKALCVEGLCVDETASCADLEPCTIESTCDLSLGCENPFEVSAECSAYTALFAEGFDDGTSGLMSVSEATGAPGAQNHAAAPGLPVSTIV